LVSEVGLRGIWVVGLLVTGATVHPGDKGEGIALGIFQTQFLTVLSIQQVVWHIHDSAADLAAE
jgi:hypothetical protein